MESTFKTVLLLHHHNMNGVRNINVNIFNKKIIKSHSHFYDHFNKDFIVIYYYEFGKKKLLDTFI